MEFLEFLNAATDAINFAHGNQDKDNIDYDGEIMKIMANLIPATSIHVIRASVVRYLQDKGKPVQDYSPEHYTEVGETPPPPPTIA